MRYFLICSCLVLLVQRYQVQAAPPGTAGAAAVSQVPEQPPVPDLPPPEDGGPSRYAYSTDQAIEHFRQIIKADPKNARAYRYLGEFIERKALETGNESLFKNAEEHLRKAIELQPNFPQAKTSLAAVLCARHRFSEALELTEQVLKTHPRDIDVLSIRGDALLELGKYVDAETLFQQLVTQSAIPEILARLANLSELKGDLSRAEQFMQRAADLVAKNGDPLADAWYRGRLGDFALETGRIDDAEKIYRSVPAQVDAYHDATANLARIRIAQNRFDEAIELYKRAIAIGADASMLIGLADLHIAMGNKELADPLFARVIESLQGYSEHRRTLAMFYADHNRELTTALELARVDYAERKDIYAADTLAWALYKNGMYREAREKIVEAMRLGTKDPKLAFHAGMIEYQLSNRQAAKELLSKAANHPALSIRDVKIAKEILGNRTLPN